MTDDYLLMVAGMTIISFVPRAVPVVFLSRVQLPKWLIDWLDLVPIAILSALLAPELFTDGAPRIFDPVNLKAAVAIPTFIVAGLTKSLGLTLVVGMLLYWLANTWGAGLF